MDKISQERTLKYNVEFKCGFFLMNRSRKTEITKYLLRDSFDNCGAISAILWASMRTF